MAESERLEFWLALLTEVTPGVGGVEVSGRGYARQPDNPGYTVTFPTATAAWGVIKGVAVFDAEEGGVCMAYGPLTSHMFVGAGDVASFAPGSIRFGDVSES
jgi:hypothetical protein